MALDFIDSCAHSGNGVGQAPISRKWTSFNQAVYSNANVRTSGTSIAVTASINKTLAYKTERYLGAAYYYPVSSSGSTNFMNFGSGGQLVAFLSIESDLSISIRSGGNNTVLYNSGVSSNLYITADVFHYYEFHCAMGGSSPVTVTCGLRVDGQTWVAGASGNTSFNASGLLVNAAQMNQIGFGGTSGGTNTGWVCDIICMNTDSTDINGNATTLNTFQGDIAVNALIPIMDETIGWSLSQGSSSFALINEIPPDNDATYVYTNTLSAVDSFLFQQLIGFPGQILGAQLLIYARKDAEGTRCIQGLLNGTAQMSLNGTQEFLYDYYDYHIFPLDSINGTPWTPSLYNVAQFGVNLSA